MRVPQETAPQSTKEQDKKDEKKETEDRIKQAEAEAIHSAEEEKKELQKEQKLGREKRKTVSTTPRTKPGGYWLRRLFYTASVTIVVVAFVIEFVSNGTFPDTKAINTDPEEQQNQTSCSNSNARKSM